MMDYNKEEFEIQYQKIFNALVMIFGILFRKLPKWFMAVTLMQRGNF